MQGSDQDPERSKEGDEDDPGLDPSRIPDPDGTSRECGDRDEHEKAGEQESPRGGNWQGTGGTFKSLAAGGRERFHRRNIEERIEAKRAAIKLGSVRGTRAPLAVAITIACAISAAPAVAAGGFEELFSDYAEEGFIDGCDHSATELREALADVPADVQAYEPGFADSVNRALDRRALGCETEPPPAPDTVQDPGEAEAAVTTDGSPGPPPPPDPAASAEAERSAPLALGLLLAALALCLTGAILAALARVYGWDLGPPLAPAGRALRRAGETISDRIWTVRDRLGF